MLKDGVCVSNPHHQQKVKDNIQREIAEEKCRTC
jgi:hypothetical protein